VRIGSGNGELNPSGFVSVYGFQQEMKYRTVNNLQQLINRPERLLPISQLVCCTTWSRHKTDSNAGGSPN